ncbi:MAG: hypothetical protein K0S55_522 [Clostridia bacterium]|nr:hypothetical protein [Clostridia bacterium]
MEENKSCCSCKSGCCSDKKSTKDIVIDFLYLDLTICERCKGTDNNLDEAINDVSGVLKAAGYKVKINKINITSKEEAIKYKFISSPTIRINGNDIAVDVKESICESCGDLCGENVDCRVWNYEGIDYNEPPKEMIVNAILKEIYAVDKSANKVGADYILPHNLEVFFEGKLNNK